MPDIGRFFNVDPLSSKYVYNSPYAFSENHVIVHVELEGLEKVYVFDKSTRPQDNGTPGTSYTATVYVEHENGNVAGPYSGSSYPNSKSNTDNSTNSNTVNEGEHQFNNASGHSKGTKQGLNLINATGQRQSPGTDPDGNSVTMSVVNVHEGTSNNGNATSRGSEGCITIAPADASNFFANFDWSGSTGKTGNSTGSVVVRRNEGIDKIHDEVHLMILKEAAQAEQKAVAPEPEQIENK